MARAAAKRKAVAKRKPAGKAAVGRPMARAKHAKRAAKPARTPQRFTVSHHREEDFKADGLRAYARYRDLGLAAATHGLVQAHVIRFTPPCTDEVRKRHYHKVDLQMVYVLKGWMKNEFEGQGEQIMRAGSCWIQPSGIRHTVLDYSDDAEVLEIILPAEFDTVEV
jgi:mannose-6-phosphate isomerase-like protein (cupin superfamily)